MAIFGLKTYFKKFFLGYYCPPIKVMSKNWVKIASKLVASWDAFQMLPLVGLKINQAFNPTRRRKVNGLNFLIAIFGRVKADAKLRAYR